MRALRHRLPQSPRRNKVIVAVVGAIAALAILEGGLFAAAVLRPHLAGAAVGRAVSAENVYPPGFSAA